MCWSPAFPSSSQSRASLGCKEDAALPPSAEQSWACTCFGLGFRGNPCGGSGTAGSSSVCTGEMHAQHGGLHGHCGLHSREARSSLC